MQSDIIRPPSIFGQPRADLARPAAMPVPADRKIQAFTSAAVVERWTESAAAVRPAALTKGDNVITMFDSIGEDWWTGEGVTAKGVAAQLRAIGDRPVEVQINSFGGDMFEGIAIYNVLREHPQAVTVKIMGMAASAASVIAMAGDRIEIGAASFLMIHNCWVVAGGNRHDFAEVSTWLEPFDRAMAELYAQRARGDAKTFATLMDKETYLSGSAAIDIGLADELLSSDQLTEDAKARARAGDLKAVRVMEQDLLSAGKTRAEARALINQIKGKRDAAPEGTPDAAAKEWAEGLSGLLATLKI